MSSANQLTNEEISIILRGMESLRKKVLAYPSSSDTIVILGRIDEIEHITKEIEAIQKAEVKPMNSSAVGGGDKKLSEVKELEKEMLEAIGYDGEGHAAVGVAWKAIRKVGEQEARLENYEANIKELREKLIAEEKAFDKAYRPLIEKLEFTRDWLAAGNKGAGTLSDTDDKQPSYTMLREKVEQREKDWEMGKLGKELECDNMTCHTTETGWFLDLLDSLNKTTRSQEE